MNRTKWQLIAIVMLVGMIALSQPAWAQRQCIPTLNNCPNQQITTSTIQIGGDGSLSSGGPAFSDPGRLDDGTIAEADLTFTYDRATGRLTLKAENKTTTTASLTAIGFNSPATATSTDITSMSLVSHTGALPWALGFDRERTDGHIDVPAVSNPKEFKMDGFGAFSVFLGNKGIDTGGNGGDHLEILAGQNVTFVIQIVGNWNNLTACSFTSIGSYIPPGNKIVTAVGRFQAGVQGGSAFIGPCVGGDLLITLANFTVEPQAGSLRASWSTASEIDNAGFAILVTDPATGKVRRANSSLIPARGDAAAGADYEYTVRGLPNGKKFDLSLEDWDINGFNTIHEAVRAVPNPQNPRISLVSPAYDARLGSTQTLRWRSDTRRYFVVEISGDARFPADGTLRLPTGTRNSRTLGSRELSLIKGMATAAEGGVYWRVHGNDSRGVTSVSQTFFLATGD